MYIDWLLEETRSGQSPLVGNHGIQVETALIVDAVNIFAFALHQLDSKENVEVRTLNGVLQSMNC